jgi:hypothetical protein
MEMDIKKKTIIKQISRQISKTNKTRYDMIWRIIAWLPNNGYQPIRNIIIYDALSVPSIFFFIIYFDYICIYSLKAMEVYMFF